MALYKSSLLCTQMSQAVQWVVQSFLCLVYMAAIIMEAVLQFQWYFGLIIAFQLWLLFVSKIMSSHSHAGATIGGSTNQASGIGMLKWCWKDDSGGVHTPCLECIIFPTFANKYTQHHNIHLSIEQ